MIQPLVCCLRHAPLPSGSRVAHRRVMACFHKTYMRVHKKLSTLIGEESFRHPGFGLAQCSSLQDRWCPKPRYTSCSRVLGNHPTVVEVFPCLLRGVGGLGSSGAFLVPSAYTRIVLTWLLSVGSFPSPSAVQGVPTISTR